jgi:chromosome segregation protein
MKVSHTVDEKSGILQREQELEEIIAQITSEQELLKLKENNYEKTLSRLSECEQRREELQQQLHQVTLKYGELLADLSAKEERLKQLEHRTIVIEQEKNESHDQIEEVSQHLSDIQISLENLKNQIIDDSTKREEFLTQRDLLRASLEESRKKAAFTKQEYNEIQIRLESSRNQIHYLHQNIQRSERQIENFTQQQKKLESTIAELNQPFVDLNNALQAKLSERLEIEGRLAEIRENLEKIDQALKKLNQERNQIELEIDKQRNELEQCRLQSQTLLVKQSTHLEQIQTDGFNVEELLADLPGETSCNDWEEKINRIETRIQRLGAINLAAIDEFSQLSERKTYLDKQNDDLIEALGTLETAIRKIDRETRTRFKETFEKLNDSFKNYFIEIFNGGDAYLELTSDDLLETGVIVRAQPPGKRNSTIHLLSGGEKALTAIALVFAIFNLNPAPFCILDEVDAPLDDINVGRFCNLVRKMSEKVQFIFISHNKITIEMGQQLAGVTMQEPGVSRMVSVDVNEAIALANA